MTQDPTIGEITQKDLEEAIRVNTSLRWQAEHDRDDFDARERAMRQRIAELETIIDRWREDRNTAPARLERINAKLAQQEAALKSMERSAPRQSTAGISAAQRAERVAALTQRIAKGDMTALAELTKLAS